MISSFRNKATEDVFNGDNSKPARGICPADIWNVARRKLQLINASRYLSDLRIPPSNHLETLEGDRKGQYSIRINGKYRICFFWNDADGYASDVEITDYH